MSPDLSIVDRRECRDFISDRLEQGGRVPTPEECVRLWRKWRETNDAIREGLNEMRAGLGQQFLAEFREYNGIPPRHEKR